MKTPIALAVSLVLGIALVAMLPASSARAQATDGSAYCISSVDSAAFPKIKTTLRLISRDGSAAEPPANLLVFENNAGTSDVVTKREDGPMHYVFIVDGGRATTAQKEAMKRAIELLTERGAFHNNQDEVTLRVLSNTTGSAPSGHTEERLGWTRSDTDLRTLLRSDIFPKNTGPTRGLDGLKDGIELIKKRLTTGPSEASVIIFVTNRIESATNAIVDAQGWADEARQEHIPIYAFQTGLGTQLQAPVQALVGSPHFVPLTGNFDAAVMAAFDQMSAQRVRYALSYTSTSAETNARRISINAPNAFGACTGSDQYTVNVPVPSVAIDTALPGLIRFNQDVQSYPIIANVTWPAGAPKRLTSAVLLINKTQRQQKNEAQLAGNADSVNFAVTELDFAGLNKAEVIVEVVDGLGRSTRSAARTIDIERAPTAAAQSGSPAPPTPQPSSLVYIAIGVGALALVTSATAIVVMARRKSAGSQNAGRSAGRTSGSWWRGSTSASQRAAASLMVIDGPASRMGERIPLSKPKYVLGRQHADVKFFTDASNSTVSRSHCTITHETDSYWIVDNTSSNGTRVNNHRILPNERTALRHGDTITLGDVKRNGVQLQFVIEDRTQMVGPGGPDAGTGLSSRTR